MLTFFNFEPIFKIFFDQQFINIITKKDSYRLEPLEELYMFSKRLSNWKKIPLKKSNKLIKEGLTEEIISMFELQKRPTSKLFTINDAVKIIKISEKIFGY